MDKPIYWEWYWGFSQDNLDLHSPKKKFTDFDKMKEYSSKHSYKHRWIGSGYWSDYDRIDPKETKPVTFERWVELENDAYADIHQKAQELSPDSTSASLHIYEEQYSIDGSLYRFLWAIDCEDKENTFPNIEKHEYYTPIKTGTTA
jgi:hypothetical protein